jgi:hypothetical protein
LNLSPSRRNIIRIVYYFGEIIGLSGGIGLGIGRFGYRLIGLPMSGLSVIWQGNSIPVEFSCSIVFKMERMVDVVGIAVDGSGNLMIGLFVTRYADPV